MTGRPSRPCTTCGMVAPTHARTTVGPVCRSCYTRDHRPARPCGHCGQTRPIARKATATTPDICHHCWRKPIVTCSVCGRERPGSRTRTGTGYCNTCRPRPDHTCAWCDTARPVQARWPRGPVCADCYTQVRHHPDRCASCARIAVLIGVDPTRQPICGPCAGSTRDYRCRGCGQAVVLFHRGRCHRCTLHERLTTLQTTTTEHTHAQLTQLRDQLIEADQPQSVLAWLRGPAGKLLTQLAASDQPLSHQLLDQQRHSRAVHHLRQLLVHAGVLTTRDEHLERIPAWLDNILAPAPDEHARLIRPFTHWAILRRARRRQPATGSTIGAAGFARSRVLVALQFLHWLDTAELTLATLTQAHIEAWLTAGSTNRYNVRYFLTWAHRRGLTAAITVPHRPNSDPATFLDDDQHYQQLHRCLTDTAMPTHVRFAGALLLLFGTRLSHTVKLRTDHVTHDSDGVYLQLDTKPVLLPPPLAALTDDLLTHRRHPNIVERGNTNQSRYLLPGRNAGRPRDEHRLADNLRRHGIDTHAGRNTALLTLATDLPAPVLAELIGLNPNTATRWAKLAQRDWTDYLLQRSTQPSHE